jgi:hypothetical protein
LVQSDHRIASHELYISSHVADYRPNYSETTESSDSDSSDECDQPPKSPSADSSVQVQPRESIAPVAPQVETAPQVRLVATPPVRPKTATTPVAPSAPPVTADVPQVASSKLFVFLEVQNTATYYDPLKVKGSFADRSCVRERPGLREFLQFCQSRNVMVIFWGTLHIDQVKYRIENIRWKVPEVGQTYHVFGNEACDQCLHQEDVGTPLYLMRLARVIPLLPEVKNAGATIDNSLVVDVVPYKNILNPTFSAVHPPITSMYSEKALKPGKLPYFQAFMIPFLDALLKSGLSVPQFCKKNPSIGQKRCVPGSDLYNQYIRVTPECQQGFEAPLSDEELGEVGSTS